MTLANMSNPNERPKWGPFDCRPSTPFEVVGEDGTVHTVTCDCGSEHPRLRFARPLASRRTPA